MKAISDKTTSEITQVECKNHSNLNVCTLEVQTSTLVCMI